MIYLIGTHHYDLQGEERLDTLISFIEPDIIALEMNEASEERFLQTQSREEFGEEFKKRDIQLSEEQINYLYRISSIISDTHGYELRVSRRYVSSDPTREIHYIDIPDLDLTSLENRIRESIEELVKDPTFEFMLKEYLATSEEERESHTSIIEAEYDLLTSLMDRGINPADEDIVQKYFPERVESYKRMMLKERDEHMSDRLKEIINANPSKKIVGITGLLHNYTIELALNEDGHDVHPIPLQWYSRYIDHIKNKVS